MRTYFSLIRRSDFIDLFKYGQAFLNPLTCIEVDYWGSKEMSGEEILNQLFEKANPFESSLSYLVIKFASSSFSVKSPLVNIEEVSHVYPLDEDAKRDFEDSFNCRIRINNPLCADAYRKIQRLRTKRDSEKGALNLLKIFSSEASINECKQIVTGDIVDEIIKGLYEDKRPSGDLSIWVYLLRYERHAYYPQEVVGYFMDAVNIVCNSLNKEEVGEEAVRGTGVGQILEGLSRKCGLREVFDVLRNEEGAKPFFEKVSEIEPRVEFLNVAVAFLMLKSRYIEGIKYEEAYFCNLAKSPITGKYYDLILYLLGIVLGQGKTYECLYERLPLQIYKSRGDVGGMPDGKTKQKKKKSEEVPEAGGKDGKNGGTKSPVAEDGCGDGKQGYGHEDGLGEKKVSEDSPEAGGEVEVNVGTETPVAEEDDGDGVQVAGHEEGLGEKGVGDGPEAGGVDEVNEETETPVAEDGSVAVGGDQKATPAGGESSSPKGAGRNESGEAKEAANQFSLFEEDEEE